MPLLNYTTRVSMGRTVSQVQEALARFGANQIMLHYANGRPVAVAFSYDDGNGTLVYRLPVRPDRVRLTLIEQGVEKRWQTEEHATNVAWRIALDWLKAQIAYAQSGQVSQTEIFLPYLLTYEIGSDGSQSFTLYEQWSSTRQANALPDPEK